MDLATRDRENMNTCISKSQRRWSISVFEIKKTYLLVSISQCTLNILGNNFAGSYFVGHPWL